ncbi:MAG: hypothetical protein QM758_19640 [Armatimonas sp.]
MLYIVESGSGDVIDRMWRLLVCARRLGEDPEIWRLTDDILAAVRAFCGLGRENSEEEAEVARFLDIPVDPTTTMPHLLCRPDIVYHL